MNHGNGFDAMLKAQREMIALGQTQLSAMQRGLDGGRDMLSAHRALTDMAEANMAAWRGWLSLWGVGRP